MFVFKFEKGFGESYGFHDLFVGKDVALWNRPGTNYFNVYLEGYPKGEGYIGWFESQKLVKKHIKKGKKLTGKIVDVDEEYKEVTIRPFIAGTNKVAGKKSSCMTLIIAGLWMMIGVAMFQTCFEDSQEVERQQIKTEEKAKERTLKYRVIEQEYSDVPLKAQIDKRVLILPNGLEVNEKNVKALIQRIYNKESKRSSKYHGKVTNVFIYAYDKEEHYEEDGLNWRGAATKGFNDPAPKILYKEPFID